METGTHMILAVRPWDDGYAAGADSPYVALASAIVYQAVKDYITTLRKMWQRTDAEKKRKLILDKMELEEFFHSTWYGTLCSYDPDKVLWNCRRCAREQEEEAVRKKNRKLVKMQVIQKREKEKAKEDAEE